MAVLAFLVLFLAMTNCSSATWCVCKDGLSDAVLQKSLDFACGAGADCNPIHQAGSCFNPNTVKNHCSYAVNSYFQKKGQAQGTCDFAGTAAISTSDPSSTGCPYPSSASTAGTSTTPVTTTPSTTPPSTTTPSTTTPSTTTPSTTTPSTTTPTTTTPTTTTPTTASPYTTTTPSNGVLGGIGTGIGPSGVGINTDESHGGLRLADTTFFSFFMAILFTGLMFCWS